MIETFTTRIVSREARRVSSPAIIHDRDYFLSDVSVCEDGLVDCWQIVDLAGFKTKLRQGWVVPAIPDGELLHIHHLATIRVTEAV